MSSGSFSYPKYSYYFSGILKFSPTFLLFQPPRQLRTLEMQEIKAISAFISAFWLRSSVASVLISSISWWKGYTTNCLYLTDLDFGLFRWI